MEDEQERRALTLQIPHAALHSSEVVDVEQPLLSASSHMVTLHVSDYQYDTPCDIHSHDPLRACDLLYPVVYKEALCLPLM